jgi:tRNA1(Val) A37 N6-methylase TrmN6
VRVPGLRLHGLELQPGYAALARRNLAGNGLVGEVWDGDLAAPPAAMTAQSYDHVLANPPYFESTKRLRARDGGRELALAGETPLETWVATAARRLRPRGHATFIQRAERLPELLAAMQAYLGALELLPLLPRAGRAPRLILVRGRKEAGAPFRFHPGQVIHAGDVHVEPGNRYTETFEAVMMRGAPLPFDAGAA